MTLSLADFTRLCLQSSSPVTRYTLLSGMQIASSVSALPQQEQKNKRQPSKQHTRQALVLIAEGWKHDSLGSSSSHRAGSQVCACLHSTIPARTALSQEHTPAGSCSLLAGAAGTSHSSRLPATMYGEDAVLSKPPAVLGWGEGTAVQYRPDYSLYLCI